LVFLKRTLERWVLLQPARPKPVDTVKSNRQATGRSFRTRSFFSTSCKGEDVADVGWRG